MWRELIVLTAIAASVAVADRPLIAQTATPDAGTQQQPADAAELEGLPIYSSDGKEVGHVASVDRGANGNISSIRAEIDGFLGLGTGQVTIHPRQFEHKTDRVVLDQSADEVRGIPGASHQSFDGAGSGAPPPAAP